MNNARGATEWQDTFGGGFTPSGSRLIQAPLELLEPWSDAAGNMQPFRSYSPAELEDLADNIRQHGIITPLRLRPIGGRFQILSGHNRCKAAKLAGLRTVPAIVEDVDDDEAALILVDSNLKQRQKITPSEKARAYKLRLEAMRRQGKRTDLTSRHDVGKSENDSAATSRHDVGKSENDSAATSRHDVGKSENDSAATSRHDVGKLGNDSAATSRHNVGKLETADVIGEQAGDTGRTVQRYVRLTYLIPELLEMVDNERLKIVCAVELSYLPPATQQMVLEALDDGLKLSAIKAKNLHASMPTTEKGVRALLSDKVKKPILTFKVECADEESAAALSSNAAFQSEVAAAVRRIMRRYLSERG